MMGRDDAVATQPAWQYTIMVYLEISETRKPTYDLEAIKAAAHRIRITAAALGFRRAEIVAIIQTIQRRQFYKSMTSYEGHRIWQDVYHVPTEAGMLDVKFTSDVVTEFVLLSFKEKDDG
jgi:motility quorum-sensing regulator/GCU-specific mRNA interferase toxin